MRKLSRDVVWAEASFSLVPLGAQEQGLQHKVGRTLWQGAWSFVPLCQSLVVGLGQGDSGRWLPSGVS